MKFKTWKLLALISLLGFGIGVYALQIDPQEGMKQKIELLNATGKVAWIQEYEYGVKFSLEGITQNFSYPSKAKRVGAVVEALENAGDKDVSVLYESDVHGPINSDDKYHDVWAVSVGGSAVRTYAETAKGWQEDNQIAPWLGLAFLVSSLFLGFMSWRVHLQAQQK